LQEGDGFADFLMDNTSSKGAFGFPDGIMERAVGALDVLLQGIVQGDRGDQDADSLVGERHPFLFTVDQDVLEDLEGGTQSDAAGGLGELTKEVEQDVEMGGEERIKIDKSPAVQAGIIELRIL